MNEAFTRIEEKYAKLMRGAQSGDTAAYHAFLRELAAFLRNVIRKRNRALGNQDIEDIVQDVLLSVHSVRATYDAGKPFLPWLYAIVRNRLADAARRYARTTRHETLVDELPVTFADESANIERDTYGDPEQLMQAIQHLPEAQRDAIEMLKLREMSLKDASALSGASISSLKVAVHRGIANLRKALGSRGSHEH